MRTPWVWSCLLSVAIFLVTAGQVAACTGITLTAADGSVVRGRTLEFGRSLDSDVILIPRGFAFTGTTPGGDVTLGAWGTIPPVHYVLTDATGATISVEYTDGNLNIYENPLGVFTNAPAFDWHMTNLRNYLQIRAEPASSVNVENISLDPLSTGGNLFGMPGDFSSPSRFVRAAVFSQMAPRPVTGQDAVMQGFHILDNFDIPEGSVPEPKGSEPPYEITEWTAMSDLKALTFSIWTHDNRAIRTLDLTQVALDGSEIQTFSLDQEQTFVTLGSG